MYIPLVSLLKIIFIGLNAKTKILAKAKLHFGPQIVKEVTFYSSNFNFYTFLPTLLLLLELSHAV